MLTVMLVNKSTSAQAVTVPLPGAVAASGTLRTFTYAGADLTKIKPGTATASSARAALALPASSITLVEVRASR